MRNIGSRIASGATAGIAATLIMTAFTLAADRAGWMTEQPPREITARSVGRLAGRRPNGRSLDALSSVAHLGFGTFLGVVHALILGQRPLPAPARAGLGALYGTAVWLATYGRLLPELALMPPPSRDERRRPQAMIVAHWIYGATLGLLDRDSRR